MPGVFVAAEAVPVGVAIERAGDDRGSERSGRVGGSSHLPPAALTTFFATSRRYPSINGSSQLTVWGSRRVGAG
jgi:hypothetical protein